LVIVAIACFGAACALERFVYGPVIDKMDGWEVVVVNVLRIVVSALLLTIAGFAFMFCVVLPRPARKRHLEPGERTGGLADVGRNKVFDKPDQRPRRGPVENCGVVWLRRVRRALLFGTGLVFLSILMFVPWESLTFSKVVARYGRGRGIALHVLAVILLVLVCGTMLQFILAGVDYGRKDGGKRSLGSCPKKRTNTENEIQK